MTEVQRILKEKVLPKEFLLPETICEFEIDERRKKIWAIELDLLFKFDDICRRNGLKYSLAFGSILGAVRHSGFIPWDDDIDVYMLREDYEKLILLGDEFSPPYFLQIPGGDYDYWVSFAKLRNSNTSAVSKTLRFSEFNQGIFLDIFVLDNCKISDLEENQAAIKELLMENSTNMRRKNPFKNEADIERCSRYPVSNPKIVYDKIEAIARQYQDEDTEYVTCATMTIYPPQRVTYKKEDAFDIVDIDFYGHLIPIPRRYDRILRTTYGDYMKLPPIEKRGVWHGDVVFDPDTSYIETLRDLRKNNSNEV